MANENYQEDNQVNYEKQRKLRKIMEKAELSFRFAMAVNFAGYHPEPVNMPIMPRNARDITLVL